MLGAVQGLAEFLPVSSSGHLAILQRLFGLNPDGLLFFDIVLHLGTLVAVCSVFYKEIFALFKKPFKTLLYLVAATAPAGVVGLLFSRFDFLEKYVLAGNFAGYFLAAAFLITAAVLYSAELYAKRTRKSLPLNGRVALSMGFAQAVAVLPGISRSGSTIAAGTFAGGSREEVSRFSFLMSVPIILSGFALELIKTFTYQPTACVASGQEGQFGLCVGIGFAAAAVFGLFSIKIMLKAIKKANYKWFAIYLAILSAVCIILQATGCI